MVAKVCTTQERVSEAQAELAAARIDLVSLANKIDNEDFTETELYRRMAALGEDLGKCEQELGQQIREVAALIPEPEEDAK